MNRMKKSCGLVLILVSMVLTTGGCNTILGREIVVSAEGIGDKSAEVNIIGVNKSKFSFWENMSMTDYWKPDNPIRLEAKKDGYLYVMRFDQNGPRQLTLGKDPVWKAWKKRKYDYLFVLADLPGIHQDQPGNADARRLIIPLKCWRGMQRTAKISLESSGIGCFNLPKCF